MGLFKDHQLDQEELFWLLYKAKDESDVYDLIQENPSIFDNDDNWRPLGNNKSNFSIVKNQQSNPIAALIEKLTNSIDATLMRRCYEEGIDPKGKTAPDTMQEAVEQFFPNHKNWDLTNPRKAQSEEIQLIADGKAGPKGKGHHDTSVIIYDHGEGQQPKDFEDTFLSLVKGNKNNIPFVQGKYNMGGSGAIVFCGDKRYQLIASKRHNGEGEFGFTLIREHEKKESDQAKETWFEYLVINGAIPSFPITEIDLELHNRKFKTGTIIKMYSYQFPSGYSAFSQDLNQSINEFLFEPALPILTVDTKERYPNNKVLENPLFGLKRRLIQEEDKYLEKSFSEAFNDSLFGQMKVNGYVFKNRVGDEDVKKTKENIRKRYFKNNMSVLFSMNGQVHGFFTSEFISRTLKMNLLKNHLLIHVECTQMNYEFRKDLFMASRDRLNEGKKTQELRKFLGSKLNQKGGVLSEIEKLRKNAVDVQSSADTKKLLVDFAKNLPKDSNILKLLKQSLKLDEMEQKKKPSSKAPGPKREPKPFHPERFPSFFKTKAQNDGEKPVAKIPIGGERTIQFETDVEDGFFDRTEEPGELQIGLVGIKGNETDGGNEKGDRKEITDVFDINKSSPNKGTIRLSLTPKDELKVDDEVQIKATLSSNAGDHEELFWLLFKAKDEGDVYQFTQEQPTFLKKKQLMVLSKMKQEFIIKI